MIEFYTTMRLIGRCSGIRCNEGWFRSHQGNIDLVRKKACCRGKTNTTAPRAEAECTETCRNETRQRTFVCRSDSRLGSVWPERQRL